MIKEGTDGIPTRFNRAPATPPGDVFVTKIVFGITAAEVVDADFVDGRFENTGDARRTRGVIFFDKFFQIF